jgi:hypothetical protein
MAKTPRGKNLFAIDHAAIESILGDANQSLLKDRDKLLRRFDTLPSRLLTSEEIQESQEFARDLDATLKEAKDARLSDGRPFSDASKIVKDFFQRVEGPLQATRDELQERITQAALSRQGHSSTKEGEPTPVVKSRSGTAAISIAGTEAVQLTLQWEVVEFNRDRLDLEALRPFLTDSALLVACNKHLKEHGANKLAGATYEQKAEI